jgi:hypothetical protein
MTTPQLPTENHVQFDEICAPVDDFETLPTITAAPESEADQTDEEQGPLDGLILAGLVTPC